MYRVVATFVVVLTLALPSAAAAFDWESSFESPGFGTWDTIMAKPGDLARVQEPAAVGLYALRARVASESCPLTTDVLGGECKRQRAQLKKAVGERSGVDSWWSFKVFWPSTYQPALRAFNVFMQWHGRGPFASQGANLSFRLDRATQRVAALYPHVIVSGCSYRQPCGRLIDLPTLSKGRWHTFMLHVRWSTGSDGLVEVWVNGLFAGRASGPNVYTGVKGPDVWLQAGIYRGDADHTAMMYYDAIRHGDSAIEVGD